MGVFGELCADQYSITREEQEAYAIRSFERGIAVQKQGAFAWEIAPVTISRGRGKLIATVDKDESLGKFHALKLRKLRPSLKNSGCTLTAGHASIISDGAAALVLVSGKKALELRLHVIARIGGLLMRRRLIYWAS